MLLNLVKIRSGSGCRIPSNPVEMQGAVMEYQETFEEYQSAWLKYKKSVEYKWS